MKKLFLLLSVGMFAFVGFGSWYWPFDDDETQDGKEMPRLSEVMAPATDLIDEASDLAEQGKISEAVEKYRKALVELDRIEIEAGERAQSPEFATLRNKRAYVGAAVDSLLMSQVQQNAKAVAVSDTVELEKKFAAEKEKNEEEKRVAEDKTMKTEETPKSPKVTKTKATEGSKAVARAKAPEKRPTTKREQAMYDIAHGDFDAAELTIKEMLAENPSGIMALNLKAALEAARGEVEAAEMTLDRAIMANPRNYVSYYNMSRLLLQTGNRTGAKRYYETGRALGGPEVAELEKAFK